MPDLQQWLEALFGHWQHWAGGAAMGAGVALATALARRLFKLRTTGIQAAAVFLFCFGADVSYFAWRDQYALNRLSALHPVVPALETAVAVREAPPSEAAVRKEAGAMGAEIVGFYVSRDVNQPRPPRRADPDGPAWKQFEQSRDSYTRETLDEFQARFGTGLTALSAKMSAAGIDSGGLQIVVRQLYNPGDVRDIAIKLDAISKE